MKQKWKEFIIDTDIKQDIKNLARNAEFKGNLTGGDIFGLIEKYSIEFAKSLKGDYKK